MSQRFQGTPQTVTTDPSCVPQHGHVNSQSRVDSQILRGLGAHYSESQPERTAGNG